MSPVPPPAPRPSADVSGLQVVWLFARLRWRLVRSTLRGGGIQAVATVIGIAGSVVVGVAGGGAVAIGTRRLDDPATLLTLLPLAVVAVVVAIGVITGVAQPVDPRVMATEPIRDRWLTVGLLTTSAFGPPGIATLLFALGLVVGTVTTPAAVAPVLAAAVGLLATLLVISRTTVNLLALLTIRFPRVGQASVGVISLGFYGSLQFLPRLFADVDDSRRADLAGLAAWTPPGRIGRAFATAADSPATALADVALGVSWLPVVAGVLALTTRRILTTSSDGRRSPRRADAGMGSVARVVRRCCGSGAVGALAWRGLLTRLRHPRSALETCVGAAIGLAIVLVPALSGDAVGAPAVLVGGAVQLSVLFMAGNSFGSDGPALGAELLCGIEPEVIVRAKIRSILIVASPLVVIGPVLAASLTDGWGYLPAGIAVGVAGLVSGTAGAIVQATFVPVAIPESDNPLASGDTGNGVLAALVLILVVTALSVVTLPFVIVLFLAVATESVVFVSLAAVVSVGGAVLVLRLAGKVATRRWRDHEPEIHTALIPSR